jgi:transcriptional regulator GlxA family with amidase domain
MQTIDIVLFHGFDELDALGPYEVLANGGFDVRLASLGGYGPITGSHGAAVGVHGAVRPDADLVLVPGGGWNDRAPAGAWAEAQRGDLPRLLRERHAAGRMVGSVCTGAMLLAAAGLVAGRRVATHHETAEELRAAGADVVDARYADDGDLVSAAGVTSGLDLAFALVARHRGAEVAAAVAREMEWPAATAPA